MGNLIPLWEQGWSHMALKGKGTLHIYRKAKAFVSIPSAVWKDSTFTFKDKEKVLVKIDGNRLIIEKIK